MKVNPKTSDLLRHMNGLTADDMGYIRAALDFYNEYGPEEVLVKDWVGSYPNDKYLSEHYYDNNALTTEIIMERLDGSSSPDLDKLLEDIRKYYIEDEEDCISYTNTLKAHYDKVQSMLSLRVEVEVFPPIDTTLP